MALTKVAKFEKYAVQHMHYTRNTVLHYEHEWAFVACGYRVINRKKRTHKKSTKKKKLY